MIIDIIDVAWSLSINKINLFFNAINYSEDRVISDHLPILFNIFLVIFLSFNHMNIRISHKKRSYSKIKE